MIVLTATPTRCADARSTSKAVKVWQRAAAERLSALSHVAQSAGQAGASTRETNTARLDPVPSDPCTPLPRHPIPTLSVPWAGAARTDATVRAAPPDLAPGDKPGQSRLKNSQRARQRSGKKCALVTAIPSLRYPVQSFLSLPISISHFRRDPSYLCIDTLSCRRPSCCGGLAQTFAVLSRRVGTHMWKWAANCSVSDL